MKHRRGYWLFAAILSAPALVAIAFLSGGGADAIANREGDSFDAGAAAILLAGTVAFAVWAAIRAARRRSY